MNRDRRGFKANLAPRAIRENPDRKANVGKPVRREFRDRRGNPDRKVLKVRVGNEENPARLSRSMRLDRWKTSRNMTMKRRISASWIPIPDVFI